MGTFAGKTIMARDYAREARRYWQNYDLTKAIAKAGAESHFQLGSWNDNPNGFRDCGVDQISIPPSQIGTDEEFKLRTESKDPAVWKPVLTYSVERAWQLYNTPWQRDGQPAIRRWQPWVAYTSGWAMFPYAWVWHHEEDENGDLHGIGPWVPTGRYLFKAIAGQMNNLIVNEKLWTPEKALLYAGKYAAHFGVNDGSKPLLSGGIVIWQYPPKPTSTPSGDGIYPVKNNGV